jgi:hypothetical protein
MSTDPTGPAGAGPAGATSPAGAPGAAGQPSEEELRAAYEAELSRITSADMMLQAAVSLLNIASYRLAPRAPAGPGDPAADGDAGSDLEQVRDSIDGVRALLEILERRMAAAELRPLRDALSQLQLAYARDAQAAGVAPGGAPPAPGEQAQPAGPGPGAAASERPAAPAQPGQPAAPGEEKQPGPGPAESSGRLWVPGR